MIKGYVLRDTLYLLITYMLGYVTLYFLKGYLSYYLVITLWFSYLIYLLYQMNQIGFSFKWRYDSNVIQYSILLMIIQISIYYALGLVYGFGHSPYSHTVYGILFNTLYIVLPIAVRELYRFYFIHSIGNRRNINSYLIVISLYLSFISIPLFKYNLLFSGLGKGSITFILDRIISTISVNLLLSYFILVGGVYPALIYSLSLIYIQLLSPVLPNINWTLDALVFTIVPLVGIILMDQYFSNKLSRYLKIPSISKYRGKKSTWLAFTLVSSILLIWFVNGFFPIHPTVILSGSMMPSLKRGDIVLVKDANINEVHMNDIVEYVSRDGRIIVHRVVDEVNYGNLKVIVTKGDANPDDDGYIYPIQVRGFVIGIIPYIGLLSIYFKDALANLFIYFNSISILGYTAFLTTLSMSVFIFIILRRRI